MSRTPASARAPARSRRAHRVLVLAFVLSPLVVLVILVLIILRGIQQRAAPSAPALAEPAATVKPETRSDG